MQGLRKEEEMCRWKQYLKRNEIDICCVSETHLNDERKLIFEKVSEKQIHVVVKNRADVKDSRKGSGGVAILVRKKIGKIKVIKIKTSDGLLWVQIESSSRFIYVASVYLVPRGSTRWENNSKIWENLERDIIEYRKNGLFS